QQIKDAYQRACGELYEAGRDFTIIDGQAIADAEVRGDRLELNGLAWRVVVLPGVDTLPLKAWRKLERFWRNGGVVVSMGALPANSESEFPSGKVKALREKMFGDDASARFNASEHGGTALFLSLGAQRLLNGALDAAIGHDVTFPFGAPLHATHRRIDG
ncbi:MAG: hypothetical protein NTU83_06370, partial [Candidatus Hydrogenedentes bacterium]|nr:hypothetical protein [Candidatus Hydrogenedentota bacterium]